MSGRNVRLVVAGWLAGLLQACASLHPYTATGDGFLDETRLQAGVMAVAAPLLLANADTCPQTHAFSGLLTTHRADWRERAVFADQRRGMVWIAAPHSPAARAGLRTGDVIYALNGDWTAGNARDHDDLRNRRLPRAVRSGPVALKLRRDGEWMDATLHPEPAGARAVEIVDHRRPVAWMAAQTLYVTRPLAMEEPEVLARELALALARETIARYGESAALRRANNLANEVWQTVNFVSGMETLDELSLRTPRHGRPPREIVTDEAHLALALAYLQAASRYRAPPLELASVQP
ncbi:MAG: hypothetical protein ACK4NO_04255 [Glycocaulis sp.]